MQALIQQSKKWMVKLSVDAQYAFLKLNHKSLALVAVAAVVVVSAAVAADALVAAASAVADVLAAVAVATAAVVLVAVDVLAAAIAAEILTNSNELLN